MKASAPIIGVDLDNTIICYDQAFHRAALDRGLIDPATPATKTAVKNAVLAKAGNQGWTELQGYVYGPGLNTATPYPDVGEFFRMCAFHGMPTVIVSHKTERAAAGPPFDLRAAALAWLRIARVRGGLVDLRTDSGFSVIFTETRAEKLDAVRRLGCSALIDDLPEIFLHPAYPKSTEFILFDPDNAHRDWSDTARASSWAEITARFFP